MAFQTFCELDVVVVYYLPIDNDRLISSYYYLAYAPSGLKTVHFYLGFGSKLQLHEICVTFLQTPTEFNWHEEQFLQLVLLQYVISCQNTMGYTPYSCPRKLLFLEIHTLHTLNIFILCSYILANNDQHDDRKPPR